MLASKGALVIAVFGILLLVTFFEGIWGLYIEDRDGRFGGLGGSYLYSIYDWHQYLKLAFEYFDQGMILRISMYCVSLGRHLRLLGLDSYILLK
ncbi:hypothetical protein BO85DRAFT_297074 [Aspergillus piperis CBS 112811]|uniref:Uncharacterized protein n=1 Tax=Aspergillus piperis CBS 112811 TaxID=1448313 RepID=A0A8G1R5M1_9EURO|nr:hypothetical protein BO85DRAFT_297074 [Aspergillus piperis CBS 112811]RAH58170.1 hypothetical protein BO85DRAFT_297074 [Aspergillus piperis CBS 112811]